MKLTIKNLTNKNDVNKMVENGIILTDDEVKAIVKEHNKNAGFFGKKSERMILKAYKMNVKCAGIYLKNNNKSYEMTVISEENKLLNVLNDIVENGTTKRVKRDVPIVIEALQTLSNPEQLFTEDNKHTLLADLHIIRKILNEVKYADGKHFKTSYGLNINTGERFEEKVPASKYMNVADEVTNINSALHIKKLGYEMPSKDWENHGQFIDICELFDINLKGFRRNSFEVEFDDNCDVNHVLRVMLGVFESINDLENANEVKRVLNNL